MQCRTWTTLKDNYEHRFPPVHITGNIWLIYKLFLFLGLAYLIGTAYSRWNEINSSSAVDLASLDQLVACCDQTDWSFEEK